MASSIPLIRSAALFPMVRWLRENDRPVRQRLRAADLGYVSEDAPERPIPLLDAFAFFRIMASEEGPDIGVRSVGPHSLHDLGTFGLVVLGARTLRDALQRAAAVLPRYCTHELLSLQRTPGGVCVRAGWSLVLDGEMMHLTQQFSAALVVALRTGRGSAPPRSHPPAPDIRPRPSPPLVRRGTRPLEVGLADDVLDAPLALHGPGAGAAPPEDWSALKGDWSCSHSVRLLLRSMASDPPTTVERLARAGGMSARSLQRLLTSEGTRVQRLSDETRRSETLDTLTGTDMALTSVARGLGYSEQPALSRAVRRWTGRSPKHLRFPAPARPTSDRDRSSGKP